MVKRNKYSKEYKNKLVSELCSGTDAAVISKREKISSNTLHKWKYNYLNGNVDEQGDNKKELFSLRNKVSELSLLLADTLLENRILKKTEKILKRTRQNGNLSIKI